MPRKTDILSISLPKSMTKSIDALSAQTEQTRSELMRNALREYLLDVNEDREKFLDAYKNTRKEKTFTMKELRTRCNL